MRLCHSDDETRRVACGGVGVWVVRVARQRVVGVSKHVSFARTYCAQTYTEQHNIIQISTDGHRCSGSPLVTPPPPSLSTTTLHTCRPKGPRSPHYRRHIGGTRCSSLTHSRLQRRSVRHLDGQCARSSAVRNTLRRPRPQYIVRLLNNSDFAYSSVQPYLPNDLRRRRRRPRP